MLSSCCVVLQLQDVEKLTTIAKEIVCMTAMGLSKCNEVESKLSKYISAANKQQPKGVPKPFTGHSRKSNSELLDMVIAFCLEKKLVTIVGTPDILQDGKVWFFPENVIKGGHN